MTQRDNVRIVDGVKIVTPAEGQQTLANGLDEMSIFPDGRVFVKLHGDSRHFLVAVVNWTGQRGLFWTINGLDVGIFKISTRGIARDGRHKGKAAVTFETWSRFLKMVSESQQGILHPEMGTIEPVATFSILVVTESTFESYNRYFGRLAVMDACPSIRTFPTRNTAMTRYVKGIHVPKSNRLVDQIEKDSIDAKMLYAELVESSLHLKTPAKPVLNMSDLRAVFEAERRNESLDDGAISKLVLSWLPQIDTTPTEFQVMWGASGAYNLENVGPMYLAYLASDRTRDGFEREVGSYASGYPSYARATYYRNTMGSRQGRLAAQKRKKSLPGVARGPLTQSSARKELRRLYHYFRNSESQQGILNPETGTP